MNEQITRPHWRQATAADLDAIDVIGNSIHLTLPERAEVFAEKFNLFPMGCRVLIYYSQIVGYGISHPWYMNRIPPLDTFLKALPSKPECIFIHDVVVLPHARAHGAAGRFVEIVAALARQLGIASLALVSVYNTDPLWATFGFEAVDDPELTDKLLSYGDTAKYMVHTLN